MNKKLLYTIIIIAAVLFLLILVRVKNNRNNDIPDNQENQNNVIENSNTVSDFKTCSELGGEICTAGIECSGKWLDASDSYECCSVTCGSDILTIDPFDINEDNDDLGGGIM